MKHAGNVSMQERGERALKENLQNKKENGTENINQDAQLSVSTDQLKAILELIEKSPRTTAISIGATDELVHVVDKAETVVELLHELFFGRRQESNEVSDSLLKVFKSVEDKVEKMSEEITRLETKIDSFEKEKDNEKRTRDEAKRETAKEVQVEEQKEDTGSNEKEEVKKDNIVKLGKSSHENRIFEEEQKASKKEADYGKVEIKGFEFEGIPYKITSNNIPRFAWNKVENTEETIKEILTQLKEQGVDVTSTMELREKGFEGVYSKFRNMDISKKMNWKSWVKSLLEEK